MPRSTKASLSHRTLVAIRLLLAGLLRGRREWLVPHPTFGAASDQYECIAHRVDIAFQLRGDTLG